MSAATLAGAGTFAVGWLTLTSWAWTDYDNEARPAFDALVHGHIGGFLSQAPSYGGSLVLRAPFVAATALWRGGELSMFRMASVPCLLAAAILGVWLFAWMRSAGRTLGAAGVVLLLCIANPLVFPALEFGHPEELLGAVLCVAAVIAGTRDRPVWAGVLLGLAVANKEWALLATGPVLVSLPRRRLIAIGAAAATASAILAPLMLSRSDGVAVQTTAAAGGNLFHPWQLWWFLGSHGHHAGLTATAVREGYRAPVAWVERIAHPLIVAMTVPLTLLYAVLRRGRPDRSAAPLLLLALLLFGRCALDPWDIPYYWVPFLFALLAWEVFEYERVPVLAPAACLAVWLALEGIPQSSLGISADGQAAVFLALALPGLCAIAARLYAPGTLRSLSLRAQGRVAPVPAT